MLSKFMAWYFINLFYYILIVQTNFKMDPRNKTFWSSCWFQMNFQSKNFLIIPTDSLFGIPFRIFLKFCLIVVKKIWLSCIGNQLVYGVVFSNYSINTFDLELQWVFWGSVFWTWLNYMWNTLNVPCSLFFRIWVGYSEYHLHFQHQSTK